MSKPDNRCGSTCVLWTLLVAGKSAIGFALGLLFADRIQSKCRQSLIISLLSFGVAAVAPMLVAILVRQINLPESDRGMRRRLRSIREASGFHGEGGEY